MASASNRPQSVVETDAEPEAEMNALEAELYKMDINLKMDNFEILIIHCDMDDDDDRAVRYFKKQLEEKVSYLKYNEQVKPKVELYSEVSLESYTPTRDLELPLQKALFVFLYVTKSFCESGMSMLEGEVALREILKKHIPENFIHVIHTKPLVTRDYKLKTKLNALKNSYFSEGEVDNSAFYSDIKKMLESRTSVLHERDEKLKIDRLEYIKTNSPETYKKIMVEKRKGEGQANDTLKSPAVNMNFEKMSSNQKPVSEVKPILNTPHVTAQQPNLDLEDGDSQLLSSLT